MNVIQIPNELSEAEVRAVVGQRTDTYLRKWQASSRGRFNWAAFFLSGLWLPYRKMYRAATILYAAIIIESVAEELVFVWWLSIPEIPRSVDRNITIVVSLICGSFGSSWYLAHVRRLVSEARAAVPEESERLVRLAQYGGTSLLGACGFFALFLLTAVAALMAVEFLIGQG